MSALSTGRIPRDDRPAARSPRRRSWRRRLLRATAGLVLVICVLAAFGAGAQALVQHRNASEHPAPGRLVDVGDHRLHLHAEGPRGTGPTVVLEAGMGTPSTSWAWVQQMLTSDVRVVSYDRAGIGWSDDRDGPVDPAGQVRDLRTALDAAGEEGPYVLVGHSLGGLFARTFAASYPEVTAGVVLVDPSHEDQYTDLPPELQATVDSASTGALLMKIASRVGITLLYNPAEALTAGMPEEAAASYAAWSASPRAASATAAEFAAFDAVADGARDRDLGDLPVRILSGADTSDASGDPSQAALLERQLSLHEQLTELSSDARRTVVPGATHFTVLTDRGHAATVAATVLDLVNEVRAG
ncbi:alpha/beta hydrolase [Blastococcus sp. MG754426]|uniref:alpha/beta fold hydrolase n=1 Tax=unclassified Blastococcus TaxID=2619396 RepID=UPI001EEFEFE3|nr:MULTISPECIES: alpha/beta hydrolase [unclassified Blastococcus]MCF6506615.1 alpha/beta hydrolase [Blastococcus sp. MG754426]MCF6510327.1 alpha/beta hydrolase [Blastococcus sp. MG754427]